jgi:hypothetical protein
MLDLMYDLPSDDTKKEFKITLGYAEEMFKKTKLEKLKVA